MTSLATQNQLTAIEDRLVSLENEHKERATLIAHLMDSIVTVTERLDKIEARKKPGPKPKDQKLEAVRAEIAADLASADYPFGRSDDAA